MYINIHIFVFIATVIFYFLLKSFKKDAYISSKNKKNSNLIYLLFAPVIVYLTYYLFVIYKNPQVHSQVNYITPITQLQQQVPVISRLTPSSPTPSIFPIESTFSDLS